MVTILLSVTCKKSIDEHGLEDTRKDFIGIKLLAISETNKGIILATLDKSFSFLRGVFIFIIMKSLRAKMLS